MSTSGTVRPRLPQSQRHQRTGGEVAAGLFALLALLVLVVGVPAALVRFVGWPLPTSMPSSDWLTAQLDTGTLLKVIAVLVWLSWAHFAVCVLVELRAERRGVGLRVHVPLGGVNQALARKLVAAMLVLFGTVGIAAPAAMAAPARSTAVAVQTVQGHGGAGLLPGVRVSGPGASATGARTGSAQAGAVTAAEHAAVAHQLGHAGVTTLYEVRPPEGRHYECLWDIAERYLGSGPRYRELVALNRGRLQPDGRTLKDPDLIYPGWVLVMPADAKGPGLRVVHPAATPGSSGSSTSGHGHAAGGHGAGSAGAGSHAQGGHVDGAGGSGSGGAGSGGAGSGGVGGAALGSHGSSPAHGSGLPGVAPQRAESSPMDAAALAAGFGVASAALAAGLLVALRRRRGALGGPRDDSEAETEVALRLAADEPTARRVDLALRDLAARLAAAGRDLPPVYAGWIEPGAITLALAPGIVDAPEPWRADASGRIWTLPHTASLDVSGGSPGPAPFPGLVCLGRRGSDGAVMLLNLEAAPGAISLGGNPGVGRHVAASVAVELATNLWSDRVALTLVGFGDDLTAIAPDRMRRVDDLAQALGEVERHTAQQVAACAQAAAASVLRGRQVWPDTRLWCPQFLILSAPPSEEEAARLVALAADPARAVGVLVVGDLPSAHWRAVVGADGALQIPVLGVDVAAQQLPPEAYRPIVRAFAPGSTGWTPAEPLPLGGGAGAGTAAAAPGSSGHAGLRSDGSAAATGRHGAPVGPGAGTPAASGQPGAGARTAREWQDSSPTGPIRIPGPGAAAGAAAAAGMLPPGDLLLVGGVPAVPPEHTDPRRTFPVEVRMLGPLDVRAPGPIEEARRAQATEIVVAVALHPEGLHPNVLAAYLWPRGADPDVQAAALATVQAWLGHGVDGRPRLFRGRDGRWHLADDVRVDWLVVAALVGAAGGPHEVEDLAAALAFVRGPAWRDLVRGRYAWLPRTRVEGRSRAVVVGAAHRLAELAIGRDEPDLAVEAVRSGLRMVPEAERLWRDLLRLEHGRGGAAAAAEIADEMYRTLTVLDVPGGPEAETDALVDALVPGHRRVA